MGFTSIFLGRVPFLIIQAVFVLMFLLTMTQPISPNPVPIHTDPEVAPTQAPPPPPPQLTASIPPLRVTDSRTSISESLDDVESTTEDDQRSKIPQKAFPAQWTLPTSGELAFLASLPNPTIGVDRKVSVSGDTDSMSLEVEPTDQQAHPEDATGAQSGPAAEASEVLSAASRRWNSVVNDTILYRRDILAVGERWGRHIRIIDVGDKKLGNASKKKSC